jgi:hypothetical protein
VEVKLGSLQDEHPDGKEEGGMLAFGECVGVAEGFLDEVDAGKAITKQGDMWGGWWWHRGWM